MVNDGTADDMNRLVRFTEALDEVEPFEGDLTVDLALAAMAVADAEQSELRAKVAELTHLLGSHADGHRCTCTMIDPGNYYVEGGNAHPPEWEQDPWCPTHPDVNQIRAELRALADNWDGKADEGEELGHAAAARAVRVDAKELRAALDDPA